ncbi:MAG: sugar nucleotide-binding protein [Flavobacteriales bacterium]|jgi:dTDP-4-dehydrorhamnose reductase
MNKILIFGGSGSLGQAIFKELNPFFDIYSTYYSQNKFKKNKRYFYFDISNDFDELLNKIKPNLIISSLKGGFSSQITFHKKLINCCEKKRIKLLFISSSSVFDFFTNFPSYENDKTFSNSMYGRVKIDIENKILRMKTKNWVILRSAMLFDKESTRLKNLIKDIKHSIPIEIFPNLIININSTNVFVKQIHYIISRKLKGIFHHGSEDLINHDEFIFSIIKNRNLKQVNYKFVYTTNENRYLALFSSTNLFPKHLQFSYEDVLLEMIEKN